MEVLLHGGDRAAGSLPLLLSAVQRLISGQSADLALERRDDAQLDEVLVMEDGKTAALIECALGLGASAAGAEKHVVGHLCEAGRLLGLAFQLVDDILGRRRRPGGDRQIGVLGRARRKAQRAGDRRLERGYARVDAVCRKCCATVRRKPRQPLRGRCELIEAAGGVTWAAAEADRLLTSALTEIDRAELPHASAVTQLREVAAFLVHRSW